MNIIKRYGESVFRPERGLRKNMLYVVRTRACKRCGGDLSLECDIYGVYVQCIQCGASYNKQDLPPEALRPRDALRAVPAPPPSASPLRPSKPAGTRR